MERVSNPRVVDVVYKTPLLRHVNLLRLISCRIIIIIIIIIITSYS